MGSNWLLTHNYIDWTGRGGVGMFLGMFFNDIGGVYCQYLVPGIKLSVPEAKDGVPVNRVIQ
jgi:hypothetical protein